VKDVNVFVKSIKGNLTGKLKLQSEEGWNIFPAFYEFSFTGQGQEQEFKFRINSTNNNLSNKLKAELEIDGKTLTKSLVTISYPHIQPQTVLHEASAKILKLDLQKNTINRIAYVMGSGDKIPDLLRDLGLYVDVFTKEPLTPEILQNYNIVITGIRAYNTYQRLSTDQKNILKFVENGGILIVQYNTLGDLLADPSPYKLTISRDRVTEEDSPVLITNPNHPLMNYPFKITQTEFEGWIQERGLYFPNEWDENFVSFLEMNDKGETPKSGSLLFAKYGKGIFIYTGLSFFRQLPAGVEGAYKLFINLLSARINE
jgi:hypothetical protein